MSRIGPAPKSRQDIPASAAPGQVPGGQAEYLRVPMAHYGPIQVPHGPADDRFVYLSDVLPTAWQAVAYADVPQGGCEATSVAEATDGLQESDEGEDPVQRASASADPDS